MDDDFSHLLRLLRNSEVHFIVVGGVALALNGYIRATEDVDIIVESSIANIQKLLDALAGWGEGFARELCIDDFDQEPGAIRLIEDFPLDVFTILSEKSYDDYYHQSLINKDGIHYLCPADLIHSKSRSVREKDQLDIAAMKRLLESE